MPAHLSLTLPITHPVLIFALAMGIFLLAPLAVQRFNLPGVIGVIVAGAIVGPHGIGLLERGQTIELLGTVGLIYLMFLAGVEVDLQGFGRARWQSVTFGLLTFGIPQVLGWGAGRALGFGTASAVLFGALLASHTLLAYPMALSMGIGRNRAVTAAVGGTIITDTAALLVLAVIAALAGGALGPGFWLRLVLSLGGFVALVVLGLPRLARWYFRRESTGTAAEFVFVMTALFAGAVLALGAGVEAIIGAFLVGLGLNRLIPAQGLLINRIHFVGEAFLIPFFLLSVGMLVDVQVLLGGGRAWLVIGALLAVGIAGKWLAAEGAGMLFRYSREERRSMFGLSVVRASATLAIALVGHDVGLFDELMESGVVVLMMATVVIGPWAMQKYGRAVALREEHAPYEVVEAPSRLLVPLSNPRTAPALLNLAMLLREERSTEPLFALTVVPEEGESAAEYVASAERMLSTGVAHAAGAGVPVQPLTRVDQNFASGIARAALETRTTTLVLGWDGRTSRQWVFGSVLDQLLEHSPQQVVVAKLGHPLNTTRRIVALVPPGADHAPGFFGAVALVKRLTHAVGADLSLLVVDGAPEPYREAVKRLKPLGEVAARAVAGWGGALDELRTTLRREDLAVLFGARRNTVAWHPALQRLPSRLVALAPESFLVVYPSERADTVRGVGPTDGMPRALTRGRIVADLPGRSAHSALDALVVRQYPTDPGRRRDILRALLHSKRGAALELAPDVVVVHGRFDFLRSPELYLGRSAAGVQFPGVDRPARLVVLLLSPSDQPGEHLAVLAEVARLLADGDRVAGLLAATTDADVVGVLAEPRAPATG